MALLKAAAAVAAGMWLGGSVSGAVVYVRAGAPAGGDGSTWARAFADLQPALQGAAAGDAIWVAAGTYYPTAGRDRAATFRLKPGVSLLGGFIGGETDLSQRNWTANPTVLSGDIGMRGDVSDNSYHVVRGADGAVLDGFTITGGNATRMGPPGGAGRPMGPPPGGPPSGGRPPGGRPIHTSPQQILEGPGDGQGGGMVNFRAAPTVRNCIFEDNRAMKGGGVYNMVSTSFPPRPDSAGKVPVFIGCTFRNNSAAGRGGGVSNDLGTSPVFLNCVFDGNRTEQKGGGMYNDFACSPVLLNCLFRGNRALSAAGMGNDGQSSPLLDHCTFTANHAEDEGPGLYQGTGPSNNPAVLHSVVWGNTCDWCGIGIYNWHDNTPVVEASVIEGGYPGASSADPRLDRSGVAASDAGKEEGYHPGDRRFTEALLPTLLAGLSRYRARPQPEPPPARTSGVAPHSARIVYVAPSGNGTGDGRSWTSAYRSLADALDDAARDGAEIWVAAGVYRPAGSGRGASFRLRPGVALYGGFRGGETSRQARDWKVNAAILSGDIGVEGKAEDNVYHVVVGADDAVLDGFVITGGYADGIGYDGHGGGLIDYRRAPQRRPNLPEVTGYSPQIRNCAFRGNYARQGGAVYNYDRAKPRFSACVFTGNRAESGGAVLDRVGVAAQYENCEFAGNTARWRGGAAYFDYGSSSVIRGGTFRDNSTGGHGGAIYSLSRASQLENTRVDVTDCRFEGNSAAGDGGAAAFDDSTLAVLRNSFLSGNSAGRDGGAVAVTNGASLESGANRMEGNSARRRGAEVFDASRE